MRKKVTIITLQNVRNYGSVLQALATQEVMESLGVDCNFINYWKNHENTVWGRLKGATRGQKIIIKIIKTIILYPSFKKESKVFGRFNSEKLHLLSGIYTNEEELEKLPINSDIYCTGSDQVWNSGWNNGLLPELFLKFVPDGVKKIAYSASFGKDRLDEWEINETKNLLSRYCAISVREKSAKDICESLGIKALHVLDPTLQVKREFWMRLASHPLMNDRYVLVYQLNTNKQFDRYAVEYARRRGCKLLRFCVKHYQALRPGKPLIIPKPEDFISAIAYADTVITDSFHATAFSCNLNVPMICIYPNEYSSRLASILELTGLEGRHLKSYDDFSYVDNHEINFASVNRVLDEHRKIGINYLKRALAD